MNKDDIHSLFNELYERQALRIKRFCRISAWDGMEYDLFQNIWLNIWQGLPRFRGECAIDTWVTRVAVNSALMFRRGEGRRKRHLSPLEDADMISDASDRLDESMQDRLFECVARLAVRDRTVVGLHLEDMSRKEIAEVVAISESHVGVVLHRIKPVLKRCITGEKS